MSTDTCRLCLKDEVNMENIFTYKTDNIKSFIKCINKLLNFEVKADDGVPNGVCRVCIEIIKYMYELRKKFRETQKKLYGNLRWKQQHSSHQKVFPRDTPNTTTKVLSDQPKVETLIKDGCRIPLELQNQNLDPVVYLVPVERTIEFYNYRQVSKTVYKKINPNKIIKSNRTKILKQSCCGCYQNSKMGSNDNLTENNCTITAESCKTHHVCNKTIDKKPASHHSRSVARNSDKALESKRSKSLSCTINDTDRNTKLKRSKSCSNGDRKSCANIRDSYSKSRPLSFNIHNANINIDSNTCLITSENTNSYLSVYNKDMKNTSLAHTKRSISPNINDKVTKYTRIEDSYVNRPAKEVLLSHWEDFVVSLENSAFK